MELEISNEFLIRVQLKYLFITVLLESKLNIDFTILIFLNYEDKAKKNCLDSSELKK